MKAVVLLPAQEVASVYLPDQKQRNNFPVLPGSAVMCFLSRHSRMWPGAVKMFREVRVISSFETIFSKVGQKFCFRDSLEIVGGSLKFGAVLGFLSNHLERQCFCKRFGDSKQLQGKRELLENRASLNVAL